jgi:hypothetical protein
LAEERRGREQAVQKERSDRVAADSRIEAHVEQLAGSNLVLEGIGAGLFFVGIFLATWAVEIAGWLG